jgi:predicted ester cyclase
VELRAESPDIPRVSVRSAEHLARTYYDLFNRRQLDQAELLVSAQAVFHYPHSREHLIGRAGYRELARLWLTAFPDASIEILQLGRDGERAFVRAELLGRGTHTGPLSFGGRLTLAPTGRLATLPLTEILDIQDGQVANVWLHFDIDEMLRRLG